MIARAWDGVTACLRFCWRAYLWLLGIWAIVCGAGWLVGSLLAGHPLNGAEFNAFMDSLPLIGRN